MSRHAIDPVLHRRRNRIVRLFGRLHYFRVNQQVGVEQWWVNE